MFLLGWVLASVGVCLWCEGLDRKSGIAMKKMEGIELRGSLFPSQGVTGKTKVAVYLQQ